MTTKTSFICFDCCKLLRCDHSGTVECPTCKVKYQADSRGGVKKIKEDKNEI